MILRRLPSFAAFHVLDQFCEIFAQSEYAMAIVNGMAAVRYSIFTPEQRELYASAFLTLLRRCAVATPAFPDVFRNVAQFVAAGGKGADTIGTAFVSLVEENTHVFPFLSPFVFQLLANPLFLGAVPTLAGIGAGLRLHLVRTQRQLQTASIDVVELTALLLIMALAELFKPDAENRLAMIVSALLGVDAVGPEAVTTAAVSRADGTATRLLDAARQHITQFIQAGGEKPLLSALHRASLRGGVARLAGYCLQDSECATQLETVHTEILARLDATDVGEVRGVARYIGLAARVRPEFIAPFLASEVETLAVNHQDRFKFWKKKGKVMLSPSAASLAIAFALDTGGGPQIANLFAPCAASFLHDDILPQRIRLELVRAAFARAGVDSHFDVTDGPPFVQLALSVLKKPTDLGEHDDAMRVLIAAFRATPALIPDPEQLLTDALAIIRTELSGSELIQLFTSTSELIEVIIVGKAITSPALLLSYHHTILRYAKIPRLAIPVLNAVRRIVGAYSTLTDSSPTRILQIASASAIIGLLKEYSKIAQEIACALFTFIKPGDYDISTVAATAEVLFAFDMPESRMAMLNSAILFQTDGEIFAPAAETLFLEFAATKYARENPGELAHAYLQASAPAASALLKLLEIDSTAVVNRLLSEPLDAAVGAAFQAFLTSPQFKDSVLRQLLYCDASFVETALLILRDSTLPFEGNAEEIYVRLSVLILDTHQPELTAIICDILAKHVTNPSAFYPEGTAREALLVETDSLGIRLLFEDLIPRSGVNHAKLLELAKAINAEHPMISAVVCGKLLSVTESADAARDIVDILIGESRGETVAAERFRALGNFALAALDARAAQCTRVLKFLIENGQSPIALSSLAKVVSAATDDSLFEASEILLRLLETILEAGTEVLLPSALRILAVVAGSRRLATYSRASESFTVIFPLVVAAAFGLERDACATAIVALSRRTGVPPLVLSDDYAEFVDGNAGVLVKAIKDIDSFVTQLQKARARENAKVRAGVCYLLAALFARDKKRLDSRKAELVHAVVEEMRSAVDAIKVSAARALALLVE
jgi:hypothetical protein